MDLSTEPGVYGTNVSPGLEMENKRANKPLVERKRRGRINKSIEELKEIVLQALNKDDKDYCKMEKADILEMVVRHLKAIRRSQLSGDTMGEPAPVWTNYRAGFNECASEVMQYMRTSNGVEPTVQMRMLNHLADCIQRVNSFPQAAEPMTATPSHMAHPMASGIASPPHHMASQPHHLTSQPHQMTSPARQMTSSPPHAMSSRLVNIPSATQEVNLPGSSPTSVIHPRVVKAEPEVPAMTQFGSSSYSSIDIKSHHASPPSHHASPPSHHASPPSSPQARSDQIVPGSHSPDLDLENASMVASDIHFKRTSALPHWAQYNTKVKDSYHLSHLKFKSQVKSRSSMASAPYSLAMREVDRKSVNALREVNTGSVWRPW